MTDKLFYRQLPIGRSFLGAGMQNLANLIGEQGNEFLQDAGICIPARAVSTIMYLHHYGPRSLVEIARALNQQHQVTAKRIASLEELSILTRKPDPNDQRRKTFQLTQKGQKEANIVETRCREAVTVFDELYQEIGVDLLQALDQAHAALLRQSMSDRVRETQSNPSGQTITRPLKSMEAT